MSTRYNLCNKRLSENTSEADNLLCELSSSTLHSGGLHLALRRSSISATIVAAYDWDQTACQVYATNFDSAVIHKADISRLTSAQLSELRADLWLLSPACQPYTVLNPDAKGAVDPRAQSFLHLIDHVLPDLAAERGHPSYILIENVGGFQGSDTRQRLRSILERLGYNIAEFILNPLQFIGLDDTTSEILHCIPLQPAESIVPRRLRHYLDGSMDDETRALFRIPDRILKKWGRLFDIVLPSGTRSCCFTRGYTQLVERAGSILQMNEQLDTTKVFDEFLVARASNDEDAVRMLDRLGLRYFTPSELLRLFHFVDPFEPDSDHSFDFVWPSGISLKSKYRLIGNSVNVEVVRRLIEYLCSEEGSQATQAESPPECQSSYSELMLIGNPGN